MNNRRSIAFLFAFLLLLAGCESHRYLDFQSNEMTLGFYTLEPVLESNHTKEPIEINGVRVNESYPITFRFFLSAGLEARPRAFEVSEIKLKGNESGTAVEVPSKKTERVNRPTKLSHQSDTLTMHFVLDNFEKEELPFEDYSLSCLVKIEEVDGTVIEERAGFYLKSSIPFGLRPN